MTRTEARAAVLAAWHALPVGERWGAAGPAAFAVRAVERYRFRAKGDRFQLVMGWLQPYLPAV